MRNLIRLTAMAGATAGTLVLVGGVASAATPAPHLQDYYSVKVTRTVSEGLTGQPVGQTGQEPWRVKNSCTTTTPTTCTTLLLWTGLSGKLYQYKSTLTQDLAHKKPLHYTSAHTFLQTCRGHKGAKIAQGWSVNQTINIVGSTVRSTDKVITKFNSTISTTYTPTPLGAGGGCIAAKEVLTGAGVSVPAPA
jgi:hypothetical protein